MRVSLSAKVRNCYAGGMLISWPLLLVLGCEQQTSISVTDGVPKQSLGKHLLNKTPHHLSTRWRWVFSFMHLANLPPRKYLPAPIG